ncbi:TetR/AcrR family transcriptional regulator [Microbacterium horticulturae]|uniref:TetR/AcrR family transcriptional regulator n=1 Tax=Microbacterium horticulturae TaxID=3028316 RepID=A0ABY8C2F6_9MICO|nr:TetR/AcrR family transcriptional regulator [Microbacterium sp. KACC 23027]WEG09028.1 TetR/AcrR family transcriptional regulator [Microbacterium sp. KACC 23027]
MANLRQKQKESTRKRLLEVALDLFVTNGYVATTIDDIATGAGTTRVTFYAHFESRQDLMRALIGELNEILDRRARPDTGGSTASPLVDAVRIGSRGLLADWLLNQARRWPRIRPYIIAATEAAAVDPDIRTLFYAWVEEVVADVVEGLDAADRFDPAARHFRGELAFANLDQTALYWMRNGGFDIDTAPEFDVMVEAWWRLVGTGGLR